MKFWATITFLPGQGAAIIALTDSRGEWAAAGRITCRSGRRSDLYEEGYRQASLRAQSHGGVLDRYSVVAEPLRFISISDGCRYKVELGVERRPANALNVEIGQPADRCMNQPANELGSIRWLASGGSYLALGVCCASQCPKLRLRGGGASA